jgi:ribosomal protein S18 acetylase RimI-like enzyme
MRLVRFGDLAQHIQDDALRWINEVRAKYPWSQRTFTHGGAKDVYVVCTNKAYFGFIECTVSDLDLTLGKPAKLYLHELHVAPAAQKQGVAFAVLEHLLGKGLPIEMVVANENEKMLKLVMKFGALYSSIAKDTRTVTLPVQSKSS